MLTKKTEVQIEGCQFVIHELTRGQMTKYIDRFDGPDAMQAQEEMIGECVHMDGKPIGLEMFQSMGMSASMKLQEAVMQVHGVAAPSPEDLEGNV